MKTFPIPSLFHPLRAGLRTGLLFAAAAALVACGGGGGGGPDGGLGAGDGAGGLSLQGPVRAVANTLYSYEASVGGSSATDAQWSWGDGTQSSGSPAAKVWHMPGSFATSANASGGAASAAQNVVVVGKPISTGAEHTCALTHTGDVACWGANDDGQLGIGITSGTADTPQAVLKTDLAQPIALGTGNSVSCALLASGQVRCWGSNGSGKLGIDDITVGESPQPLTVLADGTPLTDARALTVGGNHSCVLRAGGTVACWGDNAYGQLGTGIGAAYPSAFTIPYLSDVISVSAGADHTCALLASGTVRCWGLGTDGRLGHGKNESSSSPVDVVGLSNVLAISAGRGNTCALRGDGQVWCWGNNSDYQLGNGDTTPSPLPVRAGNPLSLEADFFVAVSVGANHTCALRNDAKVLCWGRNNNGETGNGDNGPHVTLPTLVTGSSNSNVLAISAGFNHTCALRAEASPANGNSVYCWGNGGSGQLGANDLNSSLSPQPVYGNPSFWK